METSATRSGLAGRTPGSDEVGDAGPGGHHGPRSCPLHPPADRDANVHRPDVLPDGARIAGLVHPHDVRLALPVEGRVARTSHTAPWSSVTRSPGRSWLGKTRSDSPRRVPRVRPVAPPATAPRACPCPRPRRANPGLTGPMGQDGGVTTSTPVSSRTTPSRAIGDARISKIPPGRLFRNGAAGRGRTPAARAHRVEISHRRVRS
jgi:hypothetical protein